MSTKGGIKEGIIAKRNDINIIMYSYILKIVCAINGNTHFSGNHHQENTRLNNCHSRISITLE